MHQRTEAEVPQSSRVSSSSVRLEKCDDPLQVLSLAFFTQVLLQLSQDRIRPGIGVKKIGPRVPCRLGPCLQIKDYLISHVLVQHAVPHRRKRNLVPSLSASGVSPVHWV